MFHSPQVAKFDTQCVITEGQTAVELHGVFSQSVYVRDNLL